MSQKTFSLTAGVIFLLIAVLHILRIGFGLNATIDGQAVPMWASWVAMLIAGYLAYEGLRLGKKSH
ncbi:hypothetical protein MYX82_10670 [Acidobacteria bacterium AH-259-D05]|nr:hypothetical protein [Acidobacteria bacterium AH-259-D05]